MDLKQIVLSASAKIKEAYNFGYQRQQMYMQRALHHAKGNLELADDLAGVSHSIASDIKNYNTILKLAYWLGQEKAINDSDKEVEELRKNLK